MPRDLKQEMEEFDGEYPRSWKPQVGEIIVGKVLRYEQGNTEYGPCWIVVIHDEETKEDRSCWMIHKVMRSEFKKQKPQVGERVALKRLPDHPEYKRYALRVDRNEPVDNLPDFESFESVNDTTQEEGITGQPSLMKDDLPF